MHTVPQRTKLTLLECLPHFPFFFGFLLTDKLLGVKVISTCISDEAKVIQPLLTSAFSSKFLLVLYHLLQTLRSVWPSDLEVGRVIFVPLKPVLAVFLAV